MLSTRATGASCARASAFPRADHQAVQDHAAHWQRWERTGPPAYVVALVQALAGDLAPHGWPGWKLQGGLLWAPGARCGYSPADVDWSPSAQWMIDGYERILRSHAAISDSARLDQAERQIAELRQLLE